MFDWLKSKTFPPKTQPPEPAPAPPPEPATPEVTVSPEPPVPALTGLDDSAQPTWRERLRAGLAKTRHAIGLTKLFDACTKFLPALKGFITAIGSFFF